LYHSCDIGGQKLYNDEAIVRSQYAVSWMRRGIVWQLLSMVILCFLGKPELLEQNVCGTKFKKISLSIHARFLVLITDRNAICFGSHK
jgi:hypothetical protein